MRILSTFGYCTFIGGKIDKPYLEYYVIYIIHCSKEEVREEGRKGLRKPSPDESMWENRSCDFPDFTDIVQYLHKRVSYCGAGSQHVHQQSR